MRRLAALLLAALVLATGRDGSAAEPAADRIVAIGGDVTEILFALGAGDRIVAVDLTSRHPAAARALPNVGYMRQLSAEPILALAPDHIIAVSDAGPADAVAILRQAGVRYTTVEDEPDVEGALAKVAAVAAAVGREDAGAALAAEMRRKLDAIAGEVAARTVRPRVVFLLSVGRGALLAGGRDTSADGAIRLAGGENVAAEFAGYKPFEPEAMAAADPEAVIVTDRTVEALGGVDAILALPALSGTTAVKQGRVLVFDGQKLLGFGPRLPEAVAELAAALAETGVGK